MKRPLKIGDKVKIYGWVKAIESDYWKYEEMVRCSQLNFDNLEKAFPIILKHPYYLVAKAQLDEALGDSGFTKYLKQPHELGKLEFDENGWPENPTGIFKDATIEIRETE